MHKAGHATTVRTVDLGYEQILTLRNEAGTRVRVLYGSMWLTEEGRTQDVFAASGGEVEVGSAGAVVIEGLGVARVELVRPALRARFAALGARLRGGGAWLAAAARALLPRPRTAPAPGCHP